MPIYGRVVMGVLAVFVLWTVQRAWRSGVLYSRGTPYVLDDNPTMYTIGVVVHIAMAIYCAALAAGFTNAELWQFLLRLVAQH